MSLDGVAEAMKTLADGTRLRLLLLLREGEANVSDLCTRMGLAQPIVSHHLGLLRMAGWVSNRRQGKNIYYRLAGESPAPALVRIVSDGVVITVTRSH